MLLILYRPTEVKMILARGSSNPLYLANVLRVRERDVTMEVVVGVTQCGKGPPVKECGQLLEFGKDNEADSPLEPLDGTGLADGLILVLLDPFCTSDF
jgi:hypothetical protein